MAKISDFEIVTFERAPGCWRASFTPKGAPIRMNGNILRSLLTAEDAPSEAEAIKAASDAIRILDD